MEYTDSGMNIKSERNFRKCSEDTLLKRVNSIKMSLDDNKVECNGKQIGLSLQKKKPARRRLSRSTLAEAGWPSARYLVLRSRFSPSTPV